MKINIKKTKYIKSNSSHYKVNNDILSFELPRIRKKLKLNLENFHFFKIKDIFYKENSKKYSSIPDKIGKIPFLTSTEMNNGVSKYVDIKFLHSGNAISISTNGSCFKAFYQPIDFGCSSDVEIIYNKNLNKFNALFIVTILNMESYKYAYGRKPKNYKVWNTTIKLPYKINLKDEKEPDWKYMEDYIKSLPYTKFL